MSKKTLFSILTPTKNRAKNFLPQTIQSVQGQILGNFDYEHIIIDDGSTDSTAAVVKRFAKQDKRIKYFRLPQSQGPAKALNAGLKIAKGNLITTLDDDDLLPPSSLKMRVDFMRRNTDVDWSSGFLLNIDENNRLYDDLLEQTTPLDVPGKNFFGRMLQNNLIKNNTLVIRKKCLDKINGWDENIQAGQDWALCMDLIFYKFKYALNPCYLALYRIHSRQRSAKFRKTKAWDETRTYFMQKYRRK
jgi:glycosyltransferase involved in cell wall biosynthesis